MLIYAALSVLGACTKHEKPLVADVELLRKHALPSEANLPIDELACEIIRREVKSRNVHPE